MRLGLSSAAAPEAALAELLDACARRGLGAVELREGDAHGADSDLGAAGEAAARATAAGIGIAGYRVDGGGNDLRLARLAERLGAPVLLADHSPLDIRLERGAALMAVGARAALVLRHDPAGASRFLDDAALAVRRGLDLAWDADPMVGGLGDDVRRLLDRFGDRLLHIGIRGGGPEAALQEGRGIGELMGRLALAGYAGTIALAPSSTRYRVAWDTWLGRRGGWGCGSREQDPWLVRLATAAGGGR